MSGHKNIPHEPLTPEELLAWAENRVPKQEKEAIDDPFLEDAADGIKLMENPESLLDITATLNHSIQQSSGMATGGSGAKITQMFTPQIITAVAASVCVLLVAVFMFKTSLTSPEARMADGNTAAKEEPVLAQKLDEKAEKDKKGSMADSISSTGLAKRDDSKIKPPIKTSTKETSIASTDKLTAKKKAEALKLEKEKELAASKSLEYESADDFGGADGAYIPDEEVEEEAEEDVVELADDEAADPTVSPVVADKSSGELKKEDQMTKAGNALFSTDIKNTSPKKKAKGNKVRKDEDKPRSSSGYDRNQQDDALNYRYSPDSITNFSISGSVNGLQINNYTSLDLDSKQNATYNKGIAYFNAQNYEKAHQEYEKVLKQLPNNQEVQFQQGLTYLEEGKNKKAQKHFQKVLDSQQSLNGSMTYKGYDMQYLIGLLKQKDLQNAKYYLQSGVKEKESKKLNKKY